MSRQGSPHDRDSAELIRLPSVTRKTQRGRSERREEIRAQLLAAVESLLADGESFTELSVERLASVAGVSRSTFYVYFADKGELIRAWLSDISSRLEVAASRWWALDAGAEWSDLRAALELVVTVYRPHATLMAAAFDASAYDPGVREQVETMMGRNVAGLRKHIRNGQAAGTVDARIPAAPTAAWLTWMAERGLAQLVNGASEAEIAGLVDGYTWIVWNTLYAGARA
jgi:AcrR family transcriptional regulator